MHCDPLKRREFITLLGGAAAAWPIAARAQQPAMPVIGFLGSESPDLCAHRLARIPPRPERNRLCRGPERGDRIPLGGEPKRSAAGVGGRSGSSPGDRDCREWPCGAGGQGGDHDDSDRLLQRGRPGRAWTCRQPEPAGGNLTGVTSLAAEVGPKRLELLHELVPTATIIALLVNPTNPTLAETESRDVQAAARALGLQLHVLHASTERDFDTVFATLVQLRAGGLVIGTDAFFTSRSEQLAALALRHAVPAIYQFREFAAAGGLMSYGSSLYRCVSSCRRLHRPHSQGREARRPAGPAGHESRAGHQPQDRQGARPQRPAPAARPRRRGDRMMEGARQSWRDQPVQVRPR